MFVRNAVPVYTYDTINEDKIIITHIHTYACIMFTHSYEVKSQLNHSNQ